jgi:hypothetical protein
VSLEARLVALVQAIGADVKQLRSQLQNVGGGADPWSVQVLDADYTNAKTTASDVFVGFTPAPGTRYIVDVLAAVSSAAATTGVQTCLAGPTTGITSSAVKIVSASSATADLITHTSLNTFQAATASAGAQPSLLSVQAIIDVGPTPGAGTVRLQARSEVNGGTVTFRPGSSMRWRTI